MRRAFSLIYQGGAKAVNEQYETFDFDGWRECWSVMPPVQDSDCIGTISGLIPIPRVILLAHYDRVPRRQIRFSRINIFNRDGFTCQYCARRPSRSQLNLDHVVPRAQGGPTTWENVVCCCIPCNRRKGGRTPEQAGVRLRRRPVRPRWTPLAGIAPHGVHYSEWKPFLGDLQKDAEASRSVS